MARGCCEEAGATGREDGAPLVICLIGNPNSGKTTLFNLLTGARQRTGNWPGVTVERREGMARDGSGEIAVIDLPGVYSLSPAPGAPNAGLDEALARDVVAGGEHDVLVNIVDASNLERNLYLTAQLAEVGRPMVVVLNMVDAARAAGRPVSAEALEQALGVPVVALVARRGEGVEELLAAVRRAARERAVPRVRAPWPSVVEEAAQQFRSLLQGTARRHGLDAGWLALKLLEGDPAAQRVASAAALSQAAKSRARIMKTLKEVPDLVLADARYELAHELARAARRFPGAPRARTRDLSDMLDRLTLGRFLGPLTFFVAMYLLFMLTINVGGAFVDFFDILFGAVFVDGLRQLLLAAAAPAWLIALLADGIGAGIRTVATFVPIVGLLFVGLTFLEDSGYMARAAFVADRLMRRLGLPGKAFVPLIVGFGCNVPAVMAARTLEDPRARIATILMTPFMSCGARLAVFALFASAFFGAGGQNVIFLLYLLGIAAAILTGLLARRLLLRGDDGMPFVMELPPWRLPGARNLLLHSWTRLRGFVFGAGKVIIVVVAVLGMLDSLGTDGSFGNQDSARSVLSAIGRLLTPLFAPIGISADNWPATVGLFTGIFAKEVVVGTLNALYAGLAQGGVAAQAPFDLLAALREALASVPANLAALKDTLLDPLGLSSAIAPQAGAASATMVRHFASPGAAFAYMLFVLLYFPCAATFGAIVREIGWRWATFSALWSLWLAWFAASGFYQMATFASHPTFSALWLTGLALGMVGAIVLIRRLGRSGLMSVATLSPAPRHGQEA